MMTECNNRVRFFLVHNFRIVIVFRLETASHSRMESFVQRSGDPLHETSSTWISVVSAWRIGDANASALRFDGRKSGDVVAIEIAILVPAGPNSDSNHLYPHASRERTRLYRSGMGYWHWHWHCVGSGGIHHIIGKSNVFWVPRVSHQRAIEVCAYCWGIVPYRSYCNCPCAKSQKSCAAYNNAHHCGL